MFGGQIPTGAGNSRLAALTARKRPTIDINDMGIAMEAGGGQSPMLTNRAQSLSDAGIANARTTRSGMGEALEASGRTYREGLINQDLERAREQKAMDYALAAEDEMARAKSGAAVDTLQQRSKAQAYFDPAVTKMREADTATKMGLYNAQTAGTRAQAAAAARGHEMKAAAEIEAARLGAGSRALATFDEIRAGLDEETPGKDGWLWDTPAVPNDQARLDQLDDLTMNLIESLGLGGDAAASGPRDPNAITGATGAGANIVAGSDGDQRGQAIAAYARQHGIDPQMAERILVHRKLIPGAQ